MNKKVIKICLMSLLFVIVAFVSYGTYTYLSQQEEINDEYIIDEVKGNIVVTGANDVDTQVINNDLAYIDFINDFILNKYGLLDEMSSQIKISISAKNNFYTRVHINIPNLNSIPGLLYIVIDESQENSILPIKLQIANNYLQYGYDNGTTNITWINLIDLTNLTVDSTNEQFRTIINNYNHSKLKNIYTSKYYEKNEQINLNYRILVWGDYESVIDKPNYLNQQYKLDIVCKVCQAIDKYGGSIDYEND